MLGLDHNITLFLNEFARNSAYFDITLKFISDNHLIKGGFLMLLFWSVWFRVSEEQRAHRLSQVSFLCGTIVALVVGRILVSVCPFRLRPIYNEELSLVRAFEMEGYSMEVFSSFPSDHAILFYAFGFGFFYLSKRLGWLAIVYVTLFIAFPRVYLGLHYTSDILVGALVAASIAYASGRTIWRERISKPLLNWSESHPQYFYPLFFILCYQIADLFNAARSFLSVINQLISI